jgi:hypothetical protein
LTPAWGNGNLGDNSGSPFGYKGQHGAYTDQESQAIILVGHTPYVPAAPTYVAPNTLHDANPYQPLSGNPLGSGGNEDAPDAWVGVPDSQRQLYKPFLDASNQVAGGLGTALQTAADFNVLCILSEILSGQDASGHCVSKEQQLLDILALALPLLHDLPVGSLGKYKGVGGVAGHHIHAKAGFKFNPKSEYNLNEALCISEAAMRARGYAHGNMTSRQALLFDQLRADVLSGVKQNTLKEHSRIAVEALMAGGATEKEARSLVAESLRNLRRQGVKQPTHIPRFPPFVPRR